MEAQREGRNRSEEGVVESKGGEEGDGGALQHPQALLEGRATRSLQKRAKRVRNPCMKWCKSKWYMVMSIGRKERLGVESSKERKMLMKRVRSMRADPEKLGPLDMMDLELGPRWRCAQCRKSEGLPPVPQTSANVSVAAAAKQKQVAKDLAFNEPVAMPNLYGPGVGADQAEGGIPYSSDEDCDDYWCETPTLCTSCVAARRCAYRRSLLDHTSLASLTPPAMQEAKRQRHKEFTEAAASCDVPAIQRLLTTKPQSSSDCLNPYKALPDDKSLGFRVPSEPGTPTPFEQVIQRSYEFPETAVLAVQAIFQLHEAPVAVKSKALRSVCTHSIMEPVIMVQALLESGAEADTIGLSGWTPLVRSAERGFSRTVEILLAAGASVDKPTKHGFTAIMFAARQGNARSVKALLEAGADPDARNAVGWTALMWAMRNNRRGNRTVVLDLLLKAGASLDCASGSSSSCLVLAAKAGNDVAMRALIRQGASISLCDEKGRTAGEIMGGVLWRRRKALVMLRHRHKHNHAQMSTDDWVATIPHADTELGRVLGWLLSSETQEGLFRYVVGYL